MESRCCARYERLYEAKAHNWKPHQLVEWQKRLVNATEEVVKKTFLATTQLVPSVRHENELNAKDHHVPRFPELTCKRLQEIVCADIVYLAEKEKQPAVLYYRTSL